MTTIALDLSSTATGVAEPHPENEDTPHTWTYKPKASAKVLQRAQLTRAAVMMPVLEHAPDVIVLEEIGTRYVNVAIALSTVHALVLDAISANGWGSGPSVVTVEPKRLKKFATGKGNATKAEMVISAMKAGWKADDDSTDDAADSFWLWMIGEALQGSWGVSPTAYRSQIVAELAL